MIYYSDIDIELTKITSGDIKKDVNIDAIINSLKNILLTMKGSRRMLPEFGSNLQRLVFEPIDEITAREIGEEIIDSVRRWDDRIIFTDILVKPIYDKNEFYISLTFKLQNNREENKLDFILKRK